MLRSWMRPIPPPYRDIWRSDPFMSKLRLRRRVALKWNHQLILKVIIYYCFQWGLALSASNYASLLYSCNIFDNAPMCLSSYAQENPTLVLCLFLTLIFVGSSFIISFQYLIQAFLSIYLALRLTFHIFILIF